MRWVRARVVLPVLLLLVSPAQADYSALSSSTYSYCYFTASAVDGESCIERGLVLGGDCSAACFVPGGWGQVSGQLPWDVFGEGLGVFGDVVFVATASIRGDRISEEIFRVAGSCWYNNADYAGPPETAVFRFDGDPSAFEGTSATSVSEFVDLGLIEPSDVLFVNTCPYFDPLGSEPFDADLIVAGIPDEQLVVFTGAPVRPGQPSGGDVPAVSPLGVALLSVLVLGAGGAILRKRATRQPD